MSTAPKSDIPNPQLVEAVAFQIFVDQNLHDCDSSFAEESDFPHAWRVLDHEQRETYRNRADEFLSQLEAFSVKVTVSKAPKLQACLEDLMTIPARKAYSLPA